MSLFFRKLQLDVLTTQGHFGVNIAFNKGLNIVRADNSSGKSTCIQAIVYALGLEAMLGTSNAIPLPHAVTHALAHEGEEIPVSKSWVTLEIENGHGEVITVRRSILDSERSTHLVSVWQGTLSSRSAQSAEPVDYFVRMEGAAQRKEGFHRFLNTFIGWDPPVVPRHDEGKSPLYAECIFPLMIVEQKHGWSGIQARIPTHFRIREVGKRAVEFALSLDVQKNIAKKDQARSDVAKLKAAWLKLISEIRSSANILGGIVQNISDTPPIDFTIENRPIVTLPRGEKWLSPAEALALDKRSLRKLVDQKTPQVKETAKQLEDDLRRTETELANTEALASRLLEEAEAEELQLNGLTPPYS